MINVWSLIESPYLSRFTWSNMQREYIANWIDFLVLDGWDPTHTHPSSICDYFYQESYWITTTLCLMQQELLGDWCHSHLKNSLFNMNALPTIIDGLWKECEMQGWAGYFYSMKLIFLKSKLIAQQNLCPHGLLRELCMTVPICWLDYHSCQYTLGHFPCLFQIELFCVSVFHFRSFVSETYWQVENSYRFGTQ